MLALQKISATAPRPRAAEENLRHAMEAVFLDGGFAQLDTIIQRHRERISKQHRELMTQQGWIV